MLYYASKIFSAQVKVGEIGNIKYDYGKVLKDLIVISISEKALHLTNEKCISHHRILDVETRSNDIKGLSFYFVDFTKFNIGMEALKRLKSGTDVWCFYLKYIHLLDDHAVNDFEIAYPWVKDAVEELRNFNLTSEEHQEYMR